MTAADSTDRQKTGVRFFTVGGIASQLNVSPRTVHRWIANRQLVVHRIGRSLRVSEADLKTFLGPSR